MARHDDATAGGAPLDVESTLHLLTAVRGGDRVALDRLAARYVPELRLWARGRLPEWARDLNDTHDLVQDTVFRVFQKLDGFEYRGEGALRAYLRQALMNAVRNEIRRTRTRPGMAALESGVEDPGPTPVQALLSLERREHYERALARVSDEDRHLVVLRLELDMSYREIADALGKPSPDAARMAVVRAIVRVTTEMGGPAGEDLT